MKFYKNYFKIAIRYKRYRFSLIIMEDPENHLNIIKNHLYEFLHRLKITRAEFTNKFEGKILELSLKLIDTLIDNIEIYIKYIIQLHLSSVDPNREQACDICAIT